MIPRSLWKKLYDRIENRDSAINLARKFHGLVEYDTILSIYAQKYQEHVKKTMRFHQAPEKRAEYFTRYTDGEDIVTMSMTINFAPCLLARIILEIWLTMPGSQSSTTDKNEAEEAGHVSGEQGPVIKGARDMRQTITAMIRDPSLINDTRLRAQVTDCVREDDNYSPLVENIKHTLGQEYEFLLQEKLINLGISFQTEQYLRSQGFQKTPDIWLEAPILVNGKQVYWIESKASFGDEYTHGNYFRQQYFPYKNRYGRGLVIYWFGFVEEVREEHDDVCEVMAQFPTNITVLDTTMRTLKPEER